MKNKSPETDEIRKLKVVFKPKRQNSEEEKDFMKDEFAFKAMIWKKS